MAIEWDAKNDRPYSIDGTVIEYDDKPKKAVKEPEEMENGADDEEHPARRGRRPRA